MILAWTTILFYLGGTHDLPQSVNDVLGHAKGLEELEKRTIHVLDRMRKKYELKVDPEVRHLGFLITADRVLPDPSKIEALTIWPPPRMVRDIKSFISFAGIILSPLICTHFIQATKHYTV